MKIAFLWIVLVFLFSPDETLQVVLSALSPRYWSTLSALPQSYHTVRDIQKEKLLSKKVSHFPCFTSCSFLPRKSKKIQSMPFSLIKIHRHFSKEINWSAAVLTENKQWHSILLCQNWQHRSKWTTWSLTVSTIKTMSICWQKRTRYICLLMLLKVTGKTEMISKRNLTTLQAALKHLLAKLMEWPCHLTVESFLPLYSFVSVTLWSSHACVWMQVLKVVSTFST